MGDVEVNVTGNMEIPNQGQENSFFKLPQQLQLSTPVAREWITQRRENVRPWTTFINTKNFNAPPSLPRLSKRIMRNIEYFQSNYLFVFIGLIVYCLLTSPLLLIAVGISLTVGYKLSKKHNEKKLTVLGHEVTLAQQYGLVAICSIPLFIWAGAGAAVFWVIGLIQASGDNGLIVRDELGQLDMKKRSVNLDLMLISCLRLTLPGASLVIIRSRATEMYTSYLRTVGLAIIGFILVLRAIVIDFLFFFCLYYIGASFFIITLHAAFYNIEAVVKTEDSFGLLEEV